MQKHSFCKKTAITLRKQTDHIWHFEEIMTQQTGALNNAVHFAKEQAEISWHLYMNGKRRNCVKLLFKSSIASPEQIAS